MIVFPEHTKNNVVWTTEQRLKVESNENLGGVGKEIDLQFWDCGVAIEGYLKF
jgi:hypothetical protein